MFLQGNIFSFPNETCTFSLVQFGWCNFPLLNQVAHFPQFLVYLLQNRALLLLPQMSLLKQTILKQLTKIKHQSDTNRNITNKIKHNNIPSCDLSGKILLNRVSLRVQLDEVHRDKIIKVNTKAVKIYLFSVDLKQMTGNSRVFEHLSKQKF